MEFKSANPFIDIFSLIIIGAAVILSVLIIRYRKENLRSYLLIAIGIFLVFYLPILEYWSIWKSWSLWPAGFTPNGSASVLYGGGYPTADIVYKLLYLISQTALFLSVILFIEFVTRIFELGNRPIHWIPGINIISLGLQINRSLKLSTAYKILLLLWAISSLLWVYYRFLAMPLFLLGFDSISFLDQWLFNGYPDAGSSAAEIDGLDFPYLYFAELVNIVVFPLTYAAGICTFLIVRKVPVSVVG